MVYDIISSSSHTTTSLLLFTINYTIEFYNNTLEYSNFSSLEIFSSLKSIFDFIQFYTLNC